MKSYGIFSPVMGLRKDMPSILLKEAYTPDCRDVIWQQGEVHRIRKRLLEFTYQFPDKILSINNLFKYSTTEQWLLIFTKRDIAYRDKTNNRFNFINKLYNTGTITIEVANLKKVIGTGTAFSTNVKAGDFLKIGAGEVHSNSTWYEVDSIESNTVLYLKTDAVTCSGSAYVVRVTFSGTNLDYWSVINFHEKLIATNHGVNNVIVWTGSGQISDLSNCPGKCWFLYSYNDRVLLIRTIEGGTHYPFRIRWSGLGDETDWGGSGSDSGSMEVNEGYGSLQGAAVYKGNLIIFKDEAMIRAWNVEGTLVFNKRILIDGLGTVSPYSIIEMDEGIYFYASDNTFRFFTGLTARIISTEIEAVARNINATFQEYIQATMIAEFNQILWAIPEGDSQINNRIFIYDLDFAVNNWTIVDMAAAALGYYETEVSFDSWNALSVFSNWTDWWWPSWQYKAALQPLPIDLLGGYDGKIYRLNGAEKDAGQDYTGYQVFETDLGGKKRMAIFDRLLMIQAYVRQEASGVLDFHIKRDDEPTWQNAGSISLVGDREILVRELPVDYVAKIFKIKISGQNPFKFLGAILKYEEVGER